ncbi:MAG: prephenate dehydrogenase/arogenate dehydrogenase family protein [Elusimicrobia bacterium]|nr:prephenate dehydrogenase/arogenate dehydrogenase family protein [Elusimicrobiota bacterium]
MNVGVVGFGRLGRLLVRYFAHDVRMFVYDRRPDPRRVRALGATPVSLKEAARQDLVLVCVPMVDFEAAIKRLAPYVRRDAIVVDTCSVKEHPVRVMKRWLPRSVEILATHPNFGPDSAAESLEGHKLVASRVRVSRDRWREIRGLLEDKGLVIVEMTPKEHDRRMAESLVLTHFVGRALIRYGAETTGVDTEGYKRLLRILQTVQNDSWQLFADMNRFNAYAAPMRRRFLAAMHSVDRKVRR